MMGTVLACITFGGLMFGAVYVLLHDKPIQSLAAIVVALGSAPDDLRRLIQPKSNGNDQQSPPALNGLGSRLCNFAHPVKNLLTV